MKYYRNVLAAILFAACNGGAAVLTTLHAQELPRISVKGNRFVTPDGTPVLFRGVSIADPDKIERQGHWNRGLFEQLHAYGAQLIRLPVHPQAWRARTPARYLVLLDSAVSWCGQLGMYADIDWHSIGNLQTELFQDAMYNTSLQETYTFWRTIAQHFGGKYSAIAFYELFNEPTSYNGQLGTASWEGWKQINERLIKLIRSFDPSTVELVAGFDWAYNLQPLYEEPIDASGIGYVTHPYPFKRGQPWEPRWDEDFGFAAAKYPVIATEIGFEIKNGDPADGAEHYGTRITQYLEGRGISWLAWVYDPQWWPALLTSWDGYPLSGTGKFFEGAMRAGAKAR
ncbi:MAG TPA: cellulase family glycosylhydrolase [Dinghuibacter sp.]|uniref:glycoside hydrolase family 5 protein n=1 Tax=Dinghuibacter sp. TaxID=2024697 RepID=UPI002BB0852C|nr:cellulase family glycosylhydrolase [Dinghuibacter sp.]HTJ14069.1 cellulase family glycosylhydrolase [Dinghuibacter sp.]